MYMYHYHWALCVSVSRTLYMYNIVYSMFHHSWLQQCPLWTWWDPRSCQQLWSSYLHPASCLPDHSLTDTQQQQIIHKYTYMYTCSCIIQIYIIIQIIYTCIWMYNVYKCMCGCTVHAFNLVVRNTMYMSVRKYRRWCYTKTSTIKHWLWPKLGAGWIAQSWHEWQRRDTQDTSLFLDKCHVVLCAAAIHCMCPAYLPTTLAPLDANSRAYSFPRPVCRVNNKCTAFY